MKNQVEHKKRQRGISNSKWIPVWIRKELSNETCAICGRIDDLEFDHIVSSSMGGKSTRDNIQVLCRVCNTIKRDKKNNESVRAWIDSNYELFIRKQEARSTRMARIHSGEWY